MRQQYNNNKTSWNHSTTANNQHLMPLKSPWRYHHIQFGLDSQINMGAVFDFSVTSDILTSEACLGFSFISWMFVTTFLQLIFWTLTPLCHIWQERRRINMIYEVGWLIGPHFRVRWSAKLSQSTHGYKSDMNTTYPHRSQYPNFVLIGKCCKEQLIKHQHHKTHWKCESMEINLYI